MKNDIIFLIALTLIVLSGFVVVYELMQVITLRLPVLSNSNGPFSKSAGLCGLPRENGLYIIPCMNDIGYI